MFGPKLVPDCGNCTFDWPTRLEASCAACGVEECDLAELGKVEHRILENAVLLPLCEVRVVEVARNRLKNVDVRLHVKADLFGDTASDILVSSDNRSPRRVTK